LPVKGEGILAVVARSIMTPAFPEGNGDRMAVQRRLLARAPQLPQEQPWLLDELALVGKAQGVQMLDVVARLRELTKEEFVRAE
jgi:hypothetical protein